MILLSLCFLSLLAQASCANCNDVTQGMDIQLGLPPSTTAFVSGYLPKPNNWTCGVSWQSHVTLLGARGFFMRYVAGNGAASFGVSHRNTAVQGTLIFPNKLYSIYVWVFARTAPSYNDRMLIRICRWSANKQLHNPFSVDNTGVDCLFDQTIQISRQPYSVVGISWTGDTVTVHGHQRLYNVIVPGAKYWDAATFACQETHSCGHQLVSDMITINATTTNNGSVTQYQLCETCDGFPQHVFAVAQDGKIPPGFDFTNWFFLTNNTSPLQGRIVSSQPLIIACLWPVPALSPDTGVIYFNQSKNAGRRCNGYEDTNLVADHLRFALNSSSGTIRLGVISFVTSDTIFNFTCSNSSNPSNGSVFAIPFGIKNQPFYCFVAQGYEMAANKTFVGVMPADLREIVVSKYGAIYLNGYKLFSLSPLEGVILNLTSLVGSDFWTVAYAQDADVLVDIEDTYITNVLYCDSELNKVKCQQQRRYLDNGFYTATARQMPVANSVVMLPEYTGYTNVTLKVQANYTRALTLECEPWNGKEITLLVGGQVVNVSDNVCIETNRFSLNFVFDIIPPKITCDIEVRTDNCPLFSPGKINNYLKFGSICFSLTDNGGCRIPVISYSHWYQTVRNFGATLYVLYTPGDSITSVPPSFSSRLGFYDPSILYEDVCTNYNIYGIAGKGVITKTNATYHTGVYYTDHSGALTSFKNTTTGQVYAVRPCNTPEQLAIINDDIVGVISATPNNTMFNYTIATPMFYYSSNSQANCTEPIITYGSLGICADGSIGKAKLREVSSAPFSPIVTGNVTVPVNYTVSIQAEYIQISMRSVIVDCSTYVCNGNTRCLELLNQYVTACKSVENALALNARLESQEVTNMLTVDEAAYSAALRYNTTQFQNDFNISNVMPAGDNRGSFIEDLLFDKVITNGLGTVDADYKACIESKGISGDALCRQYYNGVSVLPALSDDNLLGLYSASLMGGIMLGAFGFGAPTIPFSQAVFSKLNYVALQTDFIQENQKLIANAFNNAMSNVTSAFVNVENALQHTSDAIKTVAHALNKVQTAVNTQGEALEKLTAQLGLNFDAISSSIEDIYNRLDQLAADAQVDRLINGRLAALSTFVSSQLVHYSEVKTSRRLAQEKVNECVRSQSNRFGFCGNGTHLFSMVVGAPEGLMFLHTVLLPTSYKEVNAWAGVCVSDKAFVLREPGQVLFESSGSYYVTPRNMYQPRVPTIADFVQIQSCAVTYVNVTSDEFSNIVPDYIDVNKTLNDFASQLPNFTAPELNLDRYNNTILDLSEQLKVLQNKSEELMLISDRLQQNIQNINNTFLDLEWLSRVETYIKWPWYVWLAILVALILLFCLLFWCCLATGCCGCCSCLSSSCSSFCDCRGKRLQRYDVEKVHVQ
ncbi:spike protein [Alphacoronavirus sp.]|uniref:Spike protein n=1 Tax=alphacoronavirus sp. WA2028 TaxID=3070154 RepID=A0AA48UFH9_9ALPC|nr:spike protein [Alphacoronavirus sp.]QGX41957.1 spike protein [alphacoronavirus sp. WA2028]